MTGATANMGIRIVCQFSCGAASAVATKLAIAQYSDKMPVEIINAFIKEEHSDNRRFLTDCEAWFERKVTVLRDEKFGASTIQVFRTRRFMKGLHGAPCSTVLKRKLLDAWRLPGAASTTVPSMSPSSSLLDPSPMARPRCRSDPGGTVDRARPQQG